MEGVNLAQREGPLAATLNTWYTGITLVDALGAQIHKGQSTKSLTAAIDVLEPPSRNIQAPLRLPISNVFKGQGSGIGVSGRICGGVVQVGEKLRILPGDETGVVKSQLFQSRPQVLPLTMWSAIIYEDDGVPWAADGSNVTIYLVNVDPIHLGIGSVLCDPTNIVPLVTVFTARIIVFDIQLPITSGTSVRRRRRARARCPR
jgi:elongation factor 1 alpha-like protein